jgi:hypothetical protein
MAAIGDKFKRFTVALEATLAGASASARFLRGKLPIALSYGTSCLNGDGPVASWIS